MTLSDREYLLTLERGLTVLKELNCFCDLGPREIAEKLGISRTAAFRILETLVHSGYVRKDPATRRYSLTGKVQQLSAGYAQTAWIAEIAAPLVRSFAHDIGWPCALTQPLGLEMVARYITDQESPLALRRYPTGYSLPILKCNSGLLFLAYCNEEIRSSIIAQTIHSDSQDGYLSERRQSIASLLSEIREQGWCSLDFADRPEAGIAVPILEDSRFIAAIHMRFARKAISEDRLLKEYLPKLRGLCSNIVHAIPDHVA